MNFLKEQESHSIIKNNCLETMHLVKLNTPDETFSIWIKGKKC